MQKKSLLVALFCGALCLTGCLKNEESASVAQVRIAKANELNSIADLNKAKAAAEAVYAQAELTIAQAEAELRKANAALVLAQAETEKVRAELLKVRVKLAEVEVDEEKVELQRLEAELQVYLAQYEAEIAQAEAAKQAWVNALNNLMAQAEIDEINSAKRLLEAEEALEKSVLTMEGARADSAKRYAKLYFDAYDDVQKLQKEQIVIKAEKALVEAGALEIRDALYYQIDRVNEKIAEKEAIVKYLEENQTMSPEKAEKALAEARTTLNEAYNAWKEKNQALSDATQAQVKVKGKTVEFIEKETESTWYDVFKAGVQDVYNDVPKSVAEYESKRAEKVKVGDVTVDVKVTGIKVPTDVKGEYDFIPLWQNEATKEETERYPELYVYTTDNAGKPNDFVTLTTTTIVPAAIYYDNVKVALDTAIAVKTRETELSIALTKLLSDEAIELKKKEVADDKEYIELHKKYIAAYKDTIDKYETAFKAALADAKTYETEKENAWEAFQEYMLTTYPENMSREWFINRYLADTTYQGAKRDSLAALQNFNSKKAGRAAYVTSVKTAFEAFAKAEGDYEKAINKEKAGGSAYDEKVALDAAIAAWNPKFATAQGKAKAQYNAINPGDTVWYKGDSYASAVTAETVAGTSQNETLNATVRLEEAEDAAYKGKIDFLRGTINETQYNEIVAKRNKANTRLNGDGTTQSTVKGAIQKESEAQDAYLAAKEDYEGAMGATLVAALEAWNPHFPVINTLCTFPTEVKPTITFTLSEGVAPNAKGEWIARGQKAASAQKALLDVVKAGAAQDAAIAQASVKYGDNTTGAKGYAIEKKKALDLATQKLVAAIQGDWTKYADVNLKKTDLSDYLDTKADELYQAYLDAAEKDADVNTAFETLESKYNTFDPDEINNIAGIPNPADNPWWDGTAPFSENTFGWKISNFHVDYRATMLNSKGESIPIASALFAEINSTAAYGDYVPEEIIDEKTLKVLDVRQSLQYKVEDGQNDIDVVLPDEFAVAKQNYEGDLKTFKGNMDNILAKVNDYKVKEASYKSWITERENAEKAVNEATKAEFDARKAKNDAQKNYDALKLIADEGMWVYDDGGKVWAEVKNLSGAKQEGNFTFVPITKAIELIEGNTHDYYTAEKALYAAAKTAWDTAVGDKDINLNDVKAILEAIEGKKAEINSNITELNFAKTLLQKTLKYGKLALTVFVEAYDEEIAELDEQIEVYTKIAEIYKAIMNAWLGIVDEADVAGETGPLDGEGEGDDEE